MALGLLTCMPGPISYSGVGLPVLELEFLEDGGDDQPLLGISAWRGGDRQPFPPREPLLTALSATSQY